MYEIPQNEFEILNVLLFENANVEWLRYISANRTGKTVDDGYDVVIGPVANDQTIRTVNNYIKGYFPESVAIELLFPQKLKDQYAFRTNRAIDTLKFAEVKLA